MAKLTVEVCPETGICSILRANGTKVDLMPDEADAIRAAGGDPAAVRKVVAGCDDRFAADLTGDEVGQIVRDL